MLHPSGEPELIYRQRGGFTTVRVFFFLSDPFVAAGLRLNDDSAGLAS